MTSGKLLGRAVGSGYCTCRDCGPAKARRDRRRQRRLEERQWRRDQRTKPIDWPDSDGEVQQSCCCDEGYDLGAVEVGG